jgi:signal recognition particle subunit SRP54
MFDFISRKITSIFSWVRGSGKVRQEELDKLYVQLEEALLEGDVPYEVVETFLADMRRTIDVTSFAKLQNPGAALLKHVHKQLLALLSGPAGSNEVPNFVIPSTVLFLGLQGAGKTTTLAKCARYLKNQAKKRGKERKILCGSVDYYRPAAREQLKILASQVGIDYKEAVATHPVKAAAELAAYAKAQGYEYFLLDTAGRLHINEELTAELVAVVKAVEPKYKILVLDGMTGQESLSVARTFLNTIGFDGAVMSKCDSDARGGAALAFRVTLSKPIWFVGVGEKLDDLEPFVPERMVSRLIGMGDFATLLEKADEVIDKHEQERVANRMMGGDFTLQDFLEQIDMVNKVGALQTLARYLPGVAQLSPQVVEKGQQEMKKFRAIISSMTKKERILPAILNGSRRKRIAQGAGVTAQDVNQLIEKFEQSKQFVKMMKKSGAWRR